MFGSGGGVLRFQTAACALHSPRQDGVGQQEPSLPAHPGVRRRAAGRLWGGTAASSPGRGGACRARCRVGSRAVQPGLTRRQHGQGPVSQPGGGRVRPGSALGTADIPPFLVPVGNGL